MKRKRKSSYQSKQEGSKSGRARSKERVGCWKGNSLDALVEERGEGSLFRLAKHQDGVDLPTAFTGS